MSKQEPPTEYAECRCCHSRLPLDMDIASNTVGRLCSHCKAANPGWTPERWGKINQRDAFGGC